MASQVSFDANCLRHTLRPPCDARSSRSWVVLAGGTSAARAHRQCACAGDVGGAQEAPRSGARTRRTAPRKRRVEGSSPDRLHRQQRRPAAATYPIHVAIFTAGRGAFAAVPQRAAGRRVTAVTAHARGAAAAGAAPVRAGPARARAADRTHALPPPRSHKLTRRGVCQRGAGGEGVAGSILR
eukprot:3936652-Rhodomonas_salina.1